MNVLICGGGIAGLTTAFWLLRGGHTITIVEKSPDLRGEGYMIDFFGSGYDVAEKMGLLPDLDQIHYPISGFVVMDADGREKLRVSYTAFRRLFNGRHFNFMRGDLERVLYEKIKDATQVRFGTTITSISDDKEGERVHVTFSDATTGEFDLLVGADGVHSQVRKLMFGDKARYTRFLGYYTAAFVLEDWPEKWDTGGAVRTLNVPGRQVGIYPVRGSRLATFFVYKARRQVRDFSPESAARELRYVYGGLEWVVPELLKRCDQASIYFDEVSQIELPRWSTDRAVLVGDACQCVSLLAGQGASMAMGGAYVLAEELARDNSDLSVVFRRYEERVKPAIEKKQRAGRRIAKWFVPDNRVRVAINDVFSRMAEWPLAWRLLRRLLSPDSIIFMPKAGRREGTVFSSHRSQ